MLENYNFLQKNENYSKVREIGKNRVGIICLKRGGHEQHHKEDEISAKDVKNVTQSCGEHNTGFSSKILKN